MFAAAMAVVAALVMGIMASSWQAVRAVHARAGEEVQRKSAQAQAYAADVNLAHQALEDENLGRALELLGRHRPKSGEDDIRGWEWRYLWRACRGDEIASLAGHSNSVSGVTFSPDGKHLASCGHDGRVKLWNPTTRQETVVLVHGSVVRSLAWSPDGSVLVTGANDGTVKVWEALTWKEIRSFPSSQDTHFGAVAFSPDGHILATGGSDGRLDLWDWKANTLMATLAGPLVGSLAFSPDGMTDRKSVV